MGNPLVLHSPVQELIIKLKDYEKIFQSSRDSDNKDKTFKVREINRKIGDLCIELDSILTCEKKDDYTITDEEKSFYLQRLLLLNIMSNLT